ncbi:MAG: hypothetical protein ABI605_02465 [Rhizobacter sp.]
MHASPSFQINVRRFGTWRVASVILVTAAVAVVGAWLPRALEMSSVCAWITILLLTLLSTAVLVHAGRLQPMSLRWDTQRWHLGPMATSGFEPHTGRLAVSMDLGVWMLLHFTRDDAGRLHLGTWLPVQRRGHEAAWHALRCTVYCARPVSLPAVAPF